MAQNLYNEKPKPGDLIEISRGLYKHWAIYVGDDCVIHLSPPSEDACGGAHSIMSVLCDKAIVKKDSLWRVVGTSEFRVNNLLDDKHEPRSVGDILRDAQSLVDEELPYSLFQYNCEHFVTALRYDKPECQQVRNALLTAGLGFGMALLVAFFVNKLVIGRRERRNSQ